MLIGDFKIPPELPEHVVPTWQLYLQGDSYKRIARKLKVDIFEVRNSMALVRHRFPYGTPRLYRNNCRSRDLTLGAKMRKLDYLNEMRRREGKPLLKKPRVERRDGALVLIMPKELRRWP